MTTQTYRQLIVEGIRDLPPEALEEIVDFVMFLRKRTFVRETFAREMQDVLLHAELSELSQREESHLEEEFKDYRWKE